MSAAPPFVVFCLPRSRSWWLSQWLSIVAVAPVGHDLAIEADSVDALLEMIYRRCRGTVETGAVEYWPLFRRAIPDLRIAVVLRPVEDVGRSLEALGVSPPWEQLRRRRAALEALSREPGVLTVEFDQLSDARTAARVQEHCLNVPFVWWAWDRADAVNLQLNWPARAARLLERRSAIELLKDEASTRLAFPRPFISVGEERWQDVGDMLEEMGRIHHEEATEGREGQFHLRRDVMDEMARRGELRVVIARVDGVLGGYCLWTRDHNVEADAPATMVHGPFYVVPSLARHCLGRRMLTASRDLFRAEGVERLTLHHTVHGRGARAGRLYEAMGAREYRRDYLWDIGNG
jgi:GNAT superfamily N-acetyltransferase